MDTKATETHEDKGPSTGPDCAVSTGSTSLVGALGEFTAADGEVCQCVVREHDDPPWADDCLIVDYVRANGERVEGAWIERENFRPAPAWTAAEIAAAKDEARKLEQLFESSESNTPVSRGHSEDGSR